jgi:hypothetical protein
MSLLADETAPALQQPRSSTQKLADLIASAKVGLNHKQIQNPKA